ncbi:MAG: DUF1287 domain-containing protein [Chitinophagaceae bacterium]
MGKLVLLSVSIILFSCGDSKQEELKGSHSRESYMVPAATGTRKQISDAALSLTRDHVIYDPSYFTISYPAGDVPEGKGVCTDVVIRTFRKIDIDLQKLVHEDMKKRWPQYPKLWGLPAPDRNIDHRRVPNLMEYFSSYGEARRGGTNASAYLPGDVVAWRLQNGRTHIGIIVDKRSSDGKRNMVVHNIGAGQVLEDCLFNFEVVGHYFYDGSSHP